MLSPSRYFAYRNPDVPHGKIVGVGSGVAGPLGDGYGVWLNGGVKLSIGLGDRETVAAMHSSSRDATTSTHPDISHVSVRLYTESSLA
jgi:hypothetical protein